MDESAEPQDEALRTVEPPSVTVVDSSGDVVLDVVFETSKSTLTAARRAARRESGILTRKGQLTSAVVLKAKHRVAYQVDSRRLMTQSAYFSRLLGDTRFHEGRKVSAALGSKLENGRKPVEVDIEALPWVQIHDDDEATQSAGRDVVFADLMAMLHGKKVPSFAGKKSPGLRDIATLLVMADRFDCIAPVATACMAMKPLYPAAKIRESRDDGVSVEFLNEETVRLKIFVSWYLRHASMFHTATKELVRYGSKRWVPYPEHGGKFLAAWWDLPDGLESKINRRTPLRPGVTGRAARVHLHANN
jgi:hypothetical protein